MKLLERDQILQKIFSRINASRPQSISITGDLKIGKTVLLEQILDSEVQKKHIEPTKNYCFFYKNLKKHQTGHLELITEIISSFTKGEGRELVLSENVYNTLTEIISEKQNIQTFIIVLDNFNVLTSDIAVPLEFFSFLRSLANSYNVAYIISSVCALQEMCASKEVTESPFFNIFTNIELKTFSDEEGIKLLALYEADELYSVTKQLTGFHPYLLQQAIQILQDESRQKSIETVLKLLVENNKQFVMELLNNFPDQYPQFLINLAIGVQPSEKESYILTKLVQKGYISADSGFNSEIMRSILIALNQKNKKNGIINRVLKLIFEKK